MKTSDVVLLGVGGFLLYEFFLKPKAPTVITTVPNTGLLNAGTASTVTNLLTALGKGVTQTSSPAANPNAVIPPPPSSSFTPVTASPTESPGLTSYYEGASGQTNTVLSSGATFSPATGYSDQGAALSPTTLTPPAPDYSTDNSDALVVTSAGVDD